VIAARRLHGSLHGKTMGLAREDDGLRSRRIHICRTLRRTEEAWDIVRQLRRAASSVAANYRATQRAQSDAAFAAKTALVIEEADEATFWLELLIRIELVKPPAVAALLKEANELVAIFTASKKKVCWRLRSKGATR
jgi:four helix bundle protein